MSQAAENASAPTCCWAAWAALRVGVTTTSRRSAASSTSRAAASVVVLPVPAAPSITSRPASPARAATTRRCAGSRWSMPRSRTASVTGCAARAAMVSTRSASTARTRSDVRLRTCSGTSPRSSNGTHRVRARSAMSSTSSCRTARSATTPTEAISRSASPRMSGAFHADRFAPSRVSTRSAATSRLSRPICRPGSVAGLVGELVGGVKPRSRSSLFHAATRSAPLRGTTLSGRASAHARRSQVWRSRGPGSWPGCSARHAAS